MPTRIEDTPIDTLREATIDHMIVNYGHGRLSLDASDVGWVVSIFGGNDIYVPPHANVTANVFCLFGGTDIKVRKSLKARLREFADGLREALSESGPAR